MRIAPFAIFMSLALLLAVMLLHQAAPVEIGSSSDAPLPTLHLAGMDAKTIWKQDDLHGRVTVLNVFASWCAPCAEEMPELAALKKQFPGIHLQGIAWNDTPATIRAWLAKHGNPFEAQWLDKTGDATIALGIKGIPETFIIDQQGVVRYRLAGPLTEGLRNGEVGALLNQLLHEAPHAP